MFLEVSRCELSVRLITDDESSIEEMEFSTCKNDTSTGHEKAIVM